MKTFLITREGIDAATEAILKRGAMPQSHDIKAAIRNAATPARIKSMRRLAQKKTPPTV